MSLSTDATFRRRQLTSETEKAYGAFVDRFNRMWTLSDPPHRRQY
jgi:hypothetical protein